MNVIKHIGIGIISILQTIISIVLIYYLFYEKETDTFLIIFLFLILLGLATLSCWIRGISDMGLFLSLPEMALSPFSIFRFIVGTIAAFMSITNDNIVFDYDDDCFDPDLVIQKIIKFLFYFYYDGYQEVTKLTNIMTQIFVCIPIGGALSFCWFMTIKNIFVTDNIFYAWIFATCVILLSALLCAIRGQESTVVFYHGKYKFRNKYTNSKISIYENNEGNDWDTTDKGEELGWERTSDGYGEYFTGWMIATLIFAPILGITQCIGLIFAFLSSPNTCICSSYAKFDYDEFSLPFFQRILQFFFNFVFW